MKDAIGNYQEFTTPMRDKYYEIVMNRFADLTRKQEKLVIVQALFKNRHRRKILIRFPEIRLIWVQSDLEQIRRRLEARANHLAGQSYGALINKHFELPTVPHQVLINNDGREDVLKQIRAVVGPAHQVVHQ